MANVAMYYKIRISNISFRMKFNYLIFKMFQRLVDTVK
jgi:hypothetical protein